MTNTRIQKCQNWKGPWQAYRATFFYFADEEIEVEREQAYMRSYGQGKDRN